MAGSWVMVGTATTGHSNSPYGFASDASEYEIWWNSSTGEVRAGGIYESGEHTPNTGNSAGNATNRSEAFQTGKQFIGAQ